MEKRQAFSSDIEITKCEKKKWKMTDQKIIVWKNFPISSSSKGGIMRGKMLPLVFSLYDFLLSYLLVFDVGINYKNCVSINNKITLLWICYLAKYFFFDLTTLDNLLLLCIVLSHFTSNYFCYNFVFHCIVITYLIVAL